MSMEDFIIKVYCIIDDLIKKQGKNQDPRKRGFSPALSDAEMITMEIVAEFQSIDTDKGAWEYFCNHWRFLFKNLGSRSNFAKHASNLWAMKQKIQKELAKQLGDGIHGTIIADKGLIGADYKNELYKHTGIDLQTAVRSNMTENRSKEFIKWLISTRRLVETVIGQLTDRFKIEKVRARKLWYLTNRIARKVLSHTICAFINKKKGNPPLQFELLING